MNKVILIGNLTKDPELKYAPGSGTAITTFTLAVQRNFKNTEGEYEADFVNCVAFQKLAETIANNLGKGRKIAIEGRLQVRSYEKDGSKRYVTEIIANEMQFLDKKDGATNANTNANNSKPNESSGFVPVDDSDDIPF